MDSILLFKNKYSSNFLCWLKCTFRGRPSVTFLFAYSFKFFASQGEITIVVIHNNNQAMWSIFAPRNYIWEN